jgi:hypothetical protein
MAGLRNEQLIQILENCLPIVSSFEEARETYTKKTHQFLIMDIEAALQDLRGKSNG